MSKLNDNKNFIKVIANSNSQENIKYLLNKKLNNDGDIDKILDLVVKQALLTIELKIILVDIIYQKFQENLVSCFREICQIQNNFINYINVKNDIFGLETKDFYNENDLLLKKLNQENENKLQQRLAKLEIKADNNKIKEFFKQLQTW